MVYLPPAVAFQFGNLDSGVENELWLVVIAVLVVVGVLYIYRGTRRT